MEHSLPLISTLVIAFSLALIFGFVAERFLKAPALVGYLLAGIAAGKYTPGVFADAALAAQLSEIGVMLLMFGVGLHFSIKDLWSVKGIAVPGAVLQMVIATALGAVGTYFLFGRNWGQSVVFGISLSCASTVVLLKALDVRGKLSSPDGRIAVGWLVVEDLMTVLILVILPPFASIMMPGVPGAHNRIVDMQMLIVLGKTILNAALFVAAMLIAGRRILPWAMGQVARTGSRELFTLFVLAVAVGVAYGASEFFDVSFALGAFFAGMVMRESRFAHRAAKDSLPLQDAFAVLFFVGVGMLFDWHILIEAPLEVLAVLAVILLGKSSAAFLLVWALRYPLHTAIIVAVSLAQIGEFSFILIGQAVQLGLADEHLVNLVVAGSILSIALNPIGFWVEPRLRRFMTSRWAWARRAAMREAPFETLPVETNPRKLVNQAVVFGAGQMMESVAVDLEASGCPVVAVVQDEVLAQRLSKHDVPVLMGDPQKEETWVGAHLHRARLMVVLSSDPASLAAVETARRVAPEVPVVVAAENPGVWPEVPLEKVTYVSTVAAAARLFSAQAAAAVKAGTTVGDPVNVAARDDATKRTTKSPEDAEVSEAGEEVVQETVSTVEAQAATGEAQKGAKLKAYWNKWKTALSRRAKRTKKVEPVVPPVESAENAAPVTVATSEAERQATPASDATPTETSAEATKESVPMPVTGAEERAAETFAESSAEVSESKEPVEADKQAPQGVAESAEPVEPTSGSVAVQASETTKAPDSTPTGANAENRIKVKG